MKSRAPSRRPAGVIFAASLLLVEEALALRGWQPEDNAWLTETLGVLKPSAARLQPTGQADGQRTT